MKGLKDFRRSLNKDRTSGGRPGVPAAPNTLQNVKSAVSIQPPKMVIKAVTDYRSRAPQELSFHKGDFFHVISEPGANADWFEACNPISNARGLVPANCFEILGKTARPGAGGSPSPLSPGSQIQHQQQQHPQHQPSAPGQQTPAQRAAGAAITAKGGGGLYAMVKYDFAAERDNELGATAGESIIVMAQSNFEWFVAKPIGRLGGPGLIPVAFVELRDLATNQSISNVEELISSGVIPKVEEWKQMTAEYKKNTIPLGRFDFANSNATPPLSGQIPRQEGEEVSPSLPPKDDKWGQETQQPHLYPQQQQQQQQSQPQMLAYDPQQQNQIAAADDMAAANGLPPGMPPGEPLPAGVITHATVDSFHYEQGDYWFRIQAGHVAGGSESAPPTTPRAPDGEERDLILYRLYEDFYEFQIALLDHFPSEAGRQVDPSGKQSERILPLMPGPLETVDDYITAQRRGDLDQYIIELCALPEYILRSELVRLFFEPRPGDHCTTHPYNPQQQSGQQGKSSASLGAAGSSASGGAYLTEGDRLEEIESPNPAAMAGAGSGQSNGTSKYAEDQPVGQHGRKGSGSSKGGHHTQQSGGDLSGRFDNMSMDTRSSNHSGSNSRSSGPGQQQQGGGTSSSSISNLHPSSSRMQRNPSGTTVNSHDSRNSGTTSTRISGGAPSIATTSGGGIPSSATSAPTSASSSGAAGSVSFIKIKIFHRASDDLVAIRVPPNVTHTALLEKVRERLGADIHVLRYRDTNPEPGASGMIRMHDDEDLKEWLSSGSKLNLYADRT
ncbi:unnamed protein product [Sympodiomycopsis kandeliae]